MQESSTSPAPILQVRQAIEAQWRRHLREALAVARAEELAAARASDRHERTEPRRGYRHGTVERPITPPDGTRTVTVPRGRVESQDGATREFHSPLLPRSARRTREIDDAIRGGSRGGITSRRIRTALKPWLGARHLSKRAGSRSVGRLKALFATWQRRDLSAERDAGILLDGFHLKVRLAPRGVSGPGRATRGVTEPGQTCLLRLRLPISDATTTWRAVVTDLQPRHGVAPLLVVVAGTGGLKTALTRGEGGRGPRGTTHKRENLQAHCPRHARPEMKRDDDTIIDAHDGLAARAPPVTRF